MASIIKTPAGTWKALIRKRGWPATMKTFPRKQDAKDWARRVEEEMVRGVYIDRAPSERMTLEAAMARYLAEISPTKGTGAAAREKYTAKPLLETLGEYSLAAITPQLVADYRDQRLATPSRRTGKLPSGNTIRLELALLSHLFTTAIQEWGIGLVRNPVTMIRKPKLPRQRDRRLSKEEEARLLAECAKASNVMLYWIVVLAIETGMRKGEIVSLRRDQVDLRRRIVCLSETKNGSARGVPLTRTAARILEEALCHPVRPLDSHLVFWGEAHDQATGDRKPYDFEQAWHNARVKAKLSALRFHDLRHEAVSRLVEAGLSDQEVAAISGHKSMQMLRRYTHLRAEDLVVKLDRVLA